MIRCSCRDMENCERLLETCEALWKLFAAAGGSLDPVGTGALHRHLQGLRPALRSSRHEGRRTEPFVLPGVKGILTLVVWFGFVPLGFIGVGFKSPNQSRPPIRGKLKALLFSWLCQRIGCLNGCHMDFAEVTNSQILKRRRLACSRHRSIVGSTDSSSLVYIISFLGLCWASTSPS